MLKDGKRKEMIHGFRTSGWMRYTYCKKKRSLEKEVEDKGRMEFRIQGEEIERVARIQREGIREYSWRRLDDIGRKE